MNMDDVRTLADDVLRPFLSVAGFLKTDVEEGIDEDGDQSLFLTLHFREGASSAGGSLLLDAQVALKDELEARGDPRFPHFSYDYPDDPAPFDELEAYGFE